MSPTRVIAPEAPATTVALVSPPYFLCAAAGRGSREGKPGLGAGTDWRCPSAVPQLLLPCSPFPAPRDSGRCGRCRAGALSGPTRALFITSVTQLWDKASNHPLIWLLPELPTSGWLDPGARLSFTFFLLFISASFFFFFFEKPLPVEDKAPSSFRPQNQAGT